MTTDALEKPTTTRADISLFIAFMQELEKNEYTFLLSAICSNRRHPVLMSKEADETLDALHDLHSKLPLLLTTDLYLFNPYTGQYAGLLEFSKLKSTFTLSLPEGGNHSLLRIILAHYPHLQTSPYPSPF